IKRFLVRLISIVSTHCSSPGAAKVRMDKACVVPRLKRPVPCEWGRMPTSALKSLNWSTFLPSGLFSSVRIFLWTMRSISSSKITSASHNFFLLFAYFGRYFILEFDKFTKSFKTGGDSFGDIFFRHDLSSRFDHIYLVGGSGHDNIKVAFNSFLIRRVEDQFASDPADSHS